MFLFVAFLGTTTVLCRRHHLPLPSHDILRNKISPLGSVQTFYLEFSSGADNRLFAAAFVAKEKQLVADFPAFVAERKSCFVFKISDLAAHEKERGGGGNFAFWKVWIANMITIKQKIYIP